MLNMLDVFGDPPKKSARNRGNVKYVKYVRYFGRNSAKNAQTFSIFNISPVFSLFGKKTFNISPVSWTWVHETGEMLNVFLEICSKQGKC